MPDRSFIILQSVKLLQVTQIRACHHMLVMPEAKGAFQHSAHGQDDIIFQLYFRTEIGRCHSPRSTKDNFLFGKRSEGDHTIILWDYNHAIMHNKLISYGMQMCFGIFILVLDWTFAKVSTGSYDWLPKGSKQNFK